MTALMMLAAAFATAASVPFAAEVTAERFPDADTVVLEEYERVRYNPDGTSETFEECVSKILTEQGRRGESSQSLEYSKRYGEAEISYVAKVAADGSESPIDISKTIKEATDNGSMTSNIYDPLDRKITATVPGLKVGDVLKVRTRRKVLKPRCRGKFADISVMEWDRPILRSVYEVTAPRELPLRKIAIRHALGNVVTNFTEKSDGTLVYSFVATNSPQAFPEPDMPPLYTQVQGVRVSTASSWQELSSWYWELCAPHLAKTNAAMRAKVDALAAANADRTQLMRALFRFVSQEVRYMGLTLEDASPGYSPHDVDITFDNRYGVCRDKAALLVAMLRMAGFRAFPVLIHVGAKQDPEVPQPFFNHAIVAIEAESGIPPTVSKYVLMDPTNENTKDVFPSYLCDKSFLVCRAEGENLMTSPVPPPELNQLSVATSARLSKDGSMFVESKITMNGINDTVYRGGLVRRTPEERVRLFESIAKAVNPSAELVKCEMRPKDMRNTEAMLEIDLAVKFGETLLKGRTTDELSVPFFSKALGMVNFLLRGNTSLAERRYPLAIETTTRVCEKVTVELGEAVGEIKKLPDDISVDGGRRFSRSFRIENGALVAVRSFTIDAVEFDPQAYVKLREDIKAIEKAERTRPVFRKNVLADADERTIDLVSETWTSGAEAKSWVTTNSVVKEILTYKGKKSASELKFSYNPTWEKVELVYAVVSNRDGRVSKVTAREMNVMDAGWVSSAPRYPASKLLVVNLPSVEIGSVISYRTVRTVTDAPVAAYFRRCLDSHRPCERMFLRFNEWTREVRRPRILPREVSQPEDALWRDCVTISSNVFETVDLKITSNLEPPEGISGLKAIRDWMAKYVRIAGPGLYSLRLDDQLTDPAVVLRERYASRLDYIRTLVALLRADGISAGVVFAADNADDDEELRRRDKGEFPHVAEFAHPLARVTVREGGFMGLFASEKIYFIGTENEYAELGASAWEGCDYYDPESGEFGVVSVPESALVDSTVERSEYTVREDGSVDLDVVNEIRGSGVAGFRKRYAEMLPEERSRHYQSILGRISQAATATREFETDVSSYPATSRFSCYIPGFATISGDAVSITLPPLASSLKPLTGAVRETPVAVGGADSEAEEIVIRFPEGYTKVEHLPQAMVFADPHDSAKVWMETAVSHLLKDGKLEVKIVRRVLAHPGSWYSPEYFELLKDYSRIDRSTANRTISVRR